MVPELPLSLISLRISERGRGGLSLPRVMAPGGSLAVSPGSNLYVAAHREWSCLTLGDQGSIASHLVLIYNNVGRKEFLPSSLFSFQQSFSIRLLN